ncbi:MAG: hypothetical protein KTR30_15860 [Saprospiraceae bacterium]|nr:hypothetical protein [Saprospiraceae bacterium]
MNISIFHRPAIAIWFLIAINIALSCSRQPDISLIIDENIGSPVEHGLAVLTANLDRQNISYETVNSLEQASGSRLLVVGLFSGHGEAAKLAQSSNQTILTKAESLAIWEASDRKKQVWVINGFDDRGLMYALIDAGERINRNPGTANPLTALSTIAESPDVVTRSISIYTMNRAYWESRFYDENYWAEYMDMLAKNRFNTLVVIFGYENAGFLAPSYPYFFNVDGFPEVKMRDITEAEQEKNLKALNRLIEMAHERGLDFKVGIWDHIYRGGVQAGGLTAEELATFDKGHMVDGLHAENLPDYTKAALTKFMQKVPKLDGIQFRMHNESGLKRGEEMALFWSEIITMIKTVSPDFQIDLRAKELPESIIKVASDLGLNFTITTKYWMEQMGLPFHPTHINRENQFDRRHGYADMLRYPKDYKIHWRMWNGGTHRLLLWGSPEYAKRFVASTHLYDGTGFEVNEPLATKMEAQPHKQEPFDILTPPFVYYQYEFERYWHFFQVFGRLGYNPNTPSEVWGFEFEKRFGKQAGELVQKAMHKAGWVLPMIVAACSPYGKFPTTRAWAEKQRYGHLQEYAKAEGSDIQQFASFDTEAKLLIEGGETPKRLPSATSTWFKRTHDELNELIAETEKLAPADNKELFSTLTDLKITANLALYHSHRIPAAVCYRIFKQTNDPHALDDAIRYEKLAIEAWQRIVETAGGVYAPDLMFGMHESVFMGINHHLSGHWRDELSYLKQGLEQLQAERNTLGKTNSPRTAPLYKEASSIPTANQFEIQHQAISNALVNQPINIKASIKAPKGIKWINLRYRSVNQHLDYQTLPMKAEEGSAIYQVEIPANQIDPTFDFMYFIEIMDKERNGFIYPDLEQETPYIIVKLNR